MSDNRQCENCKTEVAPSATFCPRCGQKFEAPVMSAAPPPMPPAAITQPPAPPPPLIPPPPHVAPPPQPKRRSPWPAILISCGVLFLLVVVIGGYAAYKGVQKARAEWVKLEAEMKTAPSTGTSPTGSADTKSAGESATDDEPVIEVSEDPTNNPPQAYAVEDVPPLEVQEGQPAGPVTSGDQAAGLVLAIADVQAWVAQVTEARAQGKKRQALVTVELIPDSGNYRVHLFENVEDEEPGHTATFGWYVVDKETGEVSNETMDSD